MVNFFKDIIKNIDEKIEKPVAKIDQNAIS